MADGSATMETTDEGSIRTRNETPTVHDRLGKMIEQDYWKLAKYFEYSA